MVGTPLLAKPLVVFLAGVATGPLVMPVVRGTVKGAVKLGLQVKNLVGEAASELQGIAAEASAESAPVNASPTVVTTPKK